MVKKAVLHELIAAQDLISLEQHLIFQYLANKKLDFTQSPILIDYFRHFEQNTSLFFAVSALEIETIKELEDHLERLIPQAGNYLAPRVAPFGPSAPLRAGPRSGQAPARGRRGAITAQSLFLSNAPAQALDK